MTLIKTSDDFCKRSVLAVRGGVLQVKSRRGLVFANLVHEGDTAYCAVEFLNCATFDTGARGVQHGAAWISG
ncbi:hypothetical protein [Caballeronia sp.]|jgi:hypothetical protein|uniref:hypothetical protein n=1 Tax=Caballeronia sp. TaxID=1931223 RepID=UPI003C41ECAA